MVPETCACVDEVSTPPLRAARVQVTLSSQRPPARTNSPQANFSFSSRFSARKKMITLIYNARLCLRVSGGVWRTECQAATGGSASSREGKRPALFPKRHIHTRAPFPPLSSFKHGTFSCFLPFAFVDLFGPARRGDFLFSPNASPLGGAKRCAHLVFTGAHE